MSFISLTAPPPDIANRTRWYVSVRWVILTVIAIPGILSIYLGEGLTNQVVRDTSLGLVALASNAVYYLCARQPQRSLKFYKTVAIMMLISDILIVSLIIFIKGGIESRSVVLYTLPILMSAAIFGRRPAYNTAIACALAYNLIIYGDYFGLIGTVGAYHPELSHMLPYVLNSSIFMTITLLVIGAVVSFINKLLIEQERFALESLNAMKLAQSVARLGSWEWEQSTDTLRWSKELNQLFGIGVPEVGASHDDIIRSVHPDDRPAIRRILRKSMKTGEIFSVEHRIISSGGRVHYALTEGTPIRGRHGKVIKLIGTMRDITHAKILDNAKSEFVSLASHQLRTPATSVKQYLGMLSENYAGKLTPKQLKLVKIAFESNERQLAIVDDLLRVAQIDAENLTLRIVRFDIIKLLNSILREQALKFKAKNQTVIFEPAADSMIISADKQRLTMAIDNIIDNASKYSADGTTVTVSLADTKKLISITVADQGVGVAKSDIEKLFQKFSRIDNPVSTVVGGTGLGLYLANRVVALHDGSIAVDSRLGHGTAFTITIPRQYTKK